MKISLKSRWKTKDGSPSRFVMWIIKGKTFKEAARTKGIGWKVRLKLASFIYGLESDIPVCCAFEYSIRSHKFKSSCREYRHHPHYFHCFLHRYTEHKKLRKTVPAGKRHEHYWRLVPLEQRGGDYNIMCDCGDYGKRYYTDNP